MNARLTPWLLVIALLLITLLGPVDLLASVQQNPDLLTSQSFWLQVLAASVAAFALGVKAVVGLVAAALGIPLLQSAAAKAKPETALAGGNDAGASP